jgi:hypothetical protein
MDIITLGLAKKYTNKKIKEAVFEGGKVVLDDTLTKSGYAADAWAVGNRIKEVETKIPSFDKANVGQFIVVKAIDENGKPTEWEAVDMPEIPEQVNADWNQNDPNAMDYVKNRPFHDNSVTLMQFEMTYYGPTANYPSRNEHGIIDADLANTYQTLIYESNGKPMTLDVNDKQIAVTAVFYSRKTGLYYYRLVDENGIIALEGCYNSGNTAASSQIILYSGNLGLGIAEQPCTVKIVQNDRKQLDEKFIPDTIARKTDIPDVTNGNDGVTPHIGDNGNWFIGNVDTGVKAQGDDYVLTDADVQDITAEVLTALPTWTGGAY